MTKFQNTIEIPQDVQQALDKGKSIVFFDGVCALCNSTVDFLIRKDKKNRLIFAPLQGNTASILSSYGADPLDLRSIILFDGQKAYTKSSAVFEICSILGGIWKIFYPFRYLPKKFSDAMYMLVSNNRYRWFGKKETCRLPIPQEQEKFLD